MTTHRESSSNPGPPSTSRFSGMRIATEMPDRSWINLFDAVLPHDSVWTAHMQAAVVLVAAALAYAVYLTRSGLGRRVRLDGVRVRGLFGGKQARLGALNIVLCWIFFIAMLTLMISGGLLYFGLYAGHDAAALHWYATWVIVAFAALHISTHYRIGGASQLLRIFRPALPPRLDEIELLTLQAKQSARLAQDSALPDAQASQPHSVSRWSSRAFSKTVADTLLPTRYKDGMSLNGASRLILPWRQPRPPRFWPTSFSPPASLSQAGGSSSITINV